MSTITLVSKTPINQQLDKLFQSAVTVGNHKFIPLTVKEFIEIPELPRNRDSINRVGKMRETFNNAHAKSKIDTLTEVAIGYVTQDFIDPEGARQYHKGDWYVVDGNTRKHYWAHYTDRAKEVSGITAKIHMLASAEDVEFAYYPYNNAKSTEKPADILQGMAKNYSINLRQKIFANGGYKTALDWATMHLHDMELRDKFNFFHNELKTLDSIPKDNIHCITKPNCSSLKSQAIIGSLLMALKTYGNNIKLFEMIERLSTISYEELRNTVIKGDVDPVHIIAAEFTGLSAIRGQGKGGCWLPDGNGGTYAGSTKFEARAPQMNFILYWIEKYMSNHKATYKFNDGGVKGKWDGTWANWFNEGEE